MNIVKTKFMLDKVKLEKKVLFKAIAIGERKRPDHSLYSAPLKQRAGGF